MARIERTLNAAFGNVDDIIFDENGEPLIFERKDVPKEIAQLRSVGDIDITHELELLKKLEGENNNAEN